MIGGILLGFAWANWLSPIHGIGAAVTGVYVGGLPVVAGFVASQTEFDLGGAGRSARCAGGALEGRFVPGAGSTCTGYVRASSAPRSTRPERGGGARRLDLEVAVGARRRRRR